MIPLFQGRFKSPAVQRRGCLLSCGRYIERNPLEAGLVAEPCDYPWSSARARALGAADPLVDESPEYLGLSDSAGRRQALWRGLVLGYDPREAAVRRGDWAVGEDDFRRRVLQELGRPAPRRRGRPHKATADEAAFSPRSVRSGSVA